MSLPSNIVSKITKHLSRKSANRVFVRLPESFKFDTFLNFHGVKLKINTGDSVGATLYYYDEYKPVHTNFFESLIKPGMLVFDLGASLGMYTALACKHGAKVVALEPDPSLCQYFIRPTLKKNNFLDQTTVLAEAVSNQKGTATFWLHRLGNVGAGRLFKAEDMGQNPTIIVQTDTLDDYSKQYGKPQLIKMHIEGAEVLVIRGSKQIFSGSDAPILIVEFHIPDIANLSPGTTPEDLITELKAHGYKVRTLTEPKYKESMWHIFYKNELPQESLKFFKPETQVAGGYFAQS